MVGMTLVLIVLIFFLVSVRGGRYRRADDSAEPAVCIYFAARTRRPANLLSIGAIDFRNHYRRHCRYDGEHLSRIGRPHGTGLHVARSRRSGGA